MSGVASKQEKYNRRDPNYMEDQGQTKGKRVVITCGAQGG